MNFKPQKNLSTILRAVQGGLVVLGLSLGVCATAQAQQSEDELLVMEEVIVTAQKREVNLQDVAVSVNVLTADFLDENYINSMSEAIDYMPSVTFSGTETQGTVSMRGIGTNVFGFAEPAVSLVLDGRPLRTPSLIDLVDIERIEVLRGPQSTLFGKNASAGVISVVSRGPGEEFESWVKLLATDDGEYNVSATISGPMSDNVGGLLTAFYKEREGNVFNYFSNSDVNSLQSYGVRGRLDWQASDDVSVSFIATYRETDDVCCAGVLIEEDGTSPQKLALIAPVVPGYTNAEVNQDIGPLSVSEDWSLQANIDWDIGEYTLTSITSYSESEGTFQLDMDGSPAFDAVWGIPENFLFGVQEGIGSGETTTQEFRLTSPLGDKFDYLLGFFYFDFESSTGFDRVWNICFAPPFIPGTTCGFQSTLIQGNFGTNASTSTSLFAHGTYHFTDDWRLVGGLRVMREKISYDFSRYNPSCAIFGCTASWSDSFSETNPMGDISLQYDWADGHMVYGKYTRGYKGQAIGLSSGFSDEQAANQPVDGETVDSYELGIKSMLWDNRLRLNATTFFMKYSDYQAQAATVDIGGNTEFRLINAGEIETKGLELELQVLLTEGLTLTGAATFMDAEFTEFPGAPCYDGQPEGTGPGFCMIDEDGNPTQDLKGFPLPAAPDLKYNFTLRYDFQVDWRFAPFLQLSHVYVDEQIFALDQDPASYEPSHRFTHASAGVVDRQGRYQFSVFVRNIDNETYYTSHVFGVAQRPRDIERYYGANLRVNF